MDQEWTENRSTRAVETTENLIGNFFWLALGLLKDNTLMVLDSVKALAIAPESCLSMILEPVKTPLIWITFFLADLLLTVLLAGALYYSARYYQLINRKYVDDFGFIYGAHYFGCRICLKLFLKRKTANRHFKDLHKKDVWTQHRKELWTRYLRTFKVAFYSMVGMMALNILLQCL